MALFVSGRDLHGNADPAANYLQRRSLAALREVGAVDADQAEIIDRSDKIGLGNKNNVAEVGEVDRLWAPDVNATLFPDEQRALGTVWDRFRVDSVDFPAPAVPALNFRDVPGNLGAIDPEQPFLIANLPLDLQKISRRVQLTIDRDRNPPTIQYGDILKAMMPGNANKYTDAENQQIVVLQQRFLNEILPRVVTAPQLEVPPLGEHRLRLAAEPGINVDLVSKNELTWTQGQSNHVNSQNIRPNGVTDVHNQLLFSRTPIAINFEVPPNHKMIVISDHGEQVVGPGPVALPPNAGQYLLELYDQNGRKVRDKSFTVPDLSSKSDLSAEKARMGIMSNGRQMEPELVSYAANPLRNQAYGGRNFVNGTNHQATWKFVEQGTANHQGDVAAARAAFTWPAGQLRDGTYSFVTEMKYRGEQFPVQNTVLEKYPGPLFSATVNGEKFWLVPYGPSNYHGAEYNGRQMFRAMHQGVEVTYEPATNALVITRWPGSGRSEGRWEHQVKDADFSEAQGIR